MKVFIFHMPQFNQWPPDFEGWLQEKFYGHWNYGGSWSGGLADGDSLFVHRYRVHMLEEPSLAEIALMKLQWDILGVERVNEKGYYLGDYVWASGDLRRYMRIP